jgi:O-antigen biosynthesis protein
MFILDKLEKIRRYQRTHGNRQLVREIVARLTRRFLGPGYAVSGRLPVTEDHGWVNARELVKSRVQMCAPLRLFPVSANAAGRISVVTDSVNRGHLFGGVGTAIIMAALIAEATGARLRIVTRIERAQSIGLDTVLQTYGIRVSQGIELAYAPFYDNAYEIDCFEGERFITTSWWTTASTLGSVRAGLVTYLLQEDERMFYPFGDEHLLCARVLANKDIRFVINTRLLFDHLVASGLANIAENGTWFEPAFPRDVYFPRPRVAGGKRKLLFYARPNNLRNLFYFGLEILEVALARGIVDLQQWDVVLVGKDIPKIRLDDGRYTPERLENLSWSAYAQLAGETDLALCLMYTPHPSYPPLDMAASGAVVVTNRYGLKQDLGGYSKNILAGDLTLESMLDALAHGMQLALDEPRRAAQHRANTLGGDWKNSFAEVVRDLAGAG